MLTSVTCFVYLCLSPVGVKEEGHRISPSTDCAESSLGDLNETISTEHEETMDSLFECTNDEDGQYIDLSLNPERFTGKRV